jgi:hypothetical protein
MGWGPVGGLMLLGECVARVLLAGAVLGGSLGFAVRCARLGWPTAVQLRRHLSANLIAQVSPPKVTSPSCRFPRVFPISSPVRRQPFAGKQQLPAQLEVIFVNSLRVAAARPARQ